MNDRIFEGKPLKQWMDEYPMLRSMVETDEVFWTNHKYEKFEDAIKKIGLTEDDVREAEERLERFAPYIAKVFPQTRETNGIIESPVVFIDNMKKELEKMYGQDMPGKLMLKCDSHLPISGSIKARGGIYEVLKHAEDLALEKNMLSKDDDYSVMDGEKFKEFYSGYSIAVGSTGNLGLSIGIMSAQLGFKVYVHMSSDAKQWKKDMLRSKGAVVVEYDSDYSKAVEEGRKQAESDPNMYFIDDENSKNLFLGYCVAAGRLKKQFDEMNIAVDSDNQLFVYLPCGVGGGPGGVAFGLKLIFKDNVHCFFAEPTHSPCMTMGLMTGLHEKVSVQDFGIDNITDADGLAVGRPSGFVGKTLENLISGSYTVSDEKMYAMLKKMIDSEKIELEPSALAGVIGPVKLLSEEAGKDYIKKKGLDGKMENAIHMAWATGGSMVPKEIMKEYYKKGLEILERQ
ncbi:D-serine ammonia-lyase [Peptoclostridium litorale DSM 5388]|uniref:Probable D-serine dehydratase n=1 Tax=Peptoclostridium litorale DSM 5388 TaxID=1121324 RepID=A0A069RF14_PEPLI|nr:D-serine ammonia-lyase [Peptoclostridium litorale]KDR95599.1 putative D-serine dehydratase DsdA [Peptoclostridium litorale DSM 5388]SIN99125.1 D-serine ammonia-lyase [Peptoclostridium litorale DSM 5388]